jgi:hypothetical protein
MSTRHLVLLAVTTLAFLPAPVRGQGIAIDHKPVACLVAGKYPRLDACLSPASQVARARVYFRPEDGVGWYYVPMKPEAPCFTGILPKPSKKLVGKRFLYYLDTADRQFNESRTPDTAVEIVDNAAGCQKGLPVAPTVTNASVTVFPGMPAGFVAGGAATGTVVAVGAATVAAVGGGFALANSGDSDPAPPPPEPPPTPPVSPVPPTEPPPTPPVDPPTTPTENRPPDADFRVSPDPPEGSSPLTVIFNMCRSTDPDGDELKFTFDFGDGGTFRGNCRTEHTYRNPPGPATAPATICVTDGIKGHDRCQGYAVKPKGPPTPSCSSDGKPPTVSLRAIDGGALPVIIQADASDNVGIAFVEFIAFPGEGAPEFLGSVKNPPYRVSWEPDDICGRYDIVARAVDVCENEAEDTAEVNLDIDCFIGAAGVSTTSLGLTSDLRLAGGSGRVVINGRGSLPAGAGPWRASVGLQAGENLVEALVVEGRGRSGSWRFELGGGIEPGSLRVDAGEVTLVTENAVVFRVNGRAGERLAFRFHARATEGGGGKP